MKFCICFALAILATAYCDETEDQTVKQLLGLIHDYERNNSVYQFPKDNSDFFADLENNTVSIDDGVYDFIVIGAGSSGSVAASRLSEDPDTRVLLLEAGGEDDAVSDIPAMYADLQGSRMNWGYLSTPQAAACFGMKNRQCALPRGKVLGGSSTINAIMYVRGNKADYDLWEQLGNKEWNYEKVLPYFLKCENSQIIFTDYHGHDGPLQVNYPIPPSPLLQPFLDANNELGREYLDYNGKNQLGYSKTQLNIKNGKRVSGANAYLKQARTRPNLEVSTNSFVTKIVTNIKSNSTESPQPQINVSAVEYLKGGKRYRASVEKEVILSAGAFNSPQVLQLSGIGPKKDLQKLGIPVVKDLPAVGKYLKDHPVHVGLMFRSDYTEDPVTMEQLLREYLHGKGPLTAAAPTYGIGFIETKDVPNGVPDVEYLIVPPQPVKRFPDVAFNFNDSLQKEYGSKINASKDINFYLIVLHPKSTGQVTLKSADPRDFPEINLNFFTDDQQHDLETLYRAIQFIFELTKAPAFQKIGMKQVVLDTNCDELGRFSKAYWYCYIRTITPTLYHPIGTTRMGNNQTTSVVDNKLLVHGIDNLRVADAGVMPSTVSGHTNAASFMIGERVSDFIKQKYGNV